VSVSGRSQGRQHFDTRFGFRYVSGWHLSLVINRGAIDVSNYDWDMLVISWGSRCRLMAEGGGGNSVLVNHWVANISRRSVDTDQVVERAWVNTSTGTNRADSIVRAIVVSTSTGYDDSTTR